MANINKNIIMQAGAAVANATNKAAGLSASTPEPGSIITVIQLVNGGRAIGPAALAHFTESVRNKLLSLFVSMEPVQSGSGTPSPDNVRPISGRAGLTIYVSPITNAADATTYAVDWTSEAGTVYGGTLDVVSGVLTAKWALQNVPKNGNIITPAGYPCYRFRNDNVKPVANSRDFVCSHFQKPSGNIGQNPGNGYIVNQYQNFYNIVMRNDMLATLTDWNTWLDEQEAAGTPVQFCHILATPITYQLIGTDIVTLVGDNYIWSDSGDVTITE